MFKTAAEELALKELKKKQHLSLYRKVLTKVARLKLKNLQVDIEASFGTDLFRYDLTVFLDNGKDNRSFNFYDWQEIDAAEKDAAKVLATIKTDDFQKIVCLSGY